MSYDPSMFRVAGSWLAVAVAMASGCGDQPRICQLEPIYGLGIQMEPTRPPFVPGVYRLEVTADGVTVSGEFDGMAWADAEAAGLRETLALTFDVGDPEVALTGELIDNRSFVRDSSLVLLLQRQEMWGPELVSAGPRAAEVAMFLDGAPIGSEDYVGDYELEETRGDGCGFYGVTFGVLALELP
jgi:hypothetical protein